MLSLHWSTAVGTCFENVEHRTARERERVRLVAPQRRTRRIRAACDGTFRISFITPVDRCTALDIRARGNGGSRAELKVQPLCPPA
jgi:hypothetical protein